jgi:folylpolyglutamate synthase
MLESILLGYNRSSGTKPLRIGVYTSPHVEFVRERIRIDGAPISEGDFAEAFFRLWGLVQAIDEGDRPFLSFFTFMTLLMFQVFVDKGVDCAIVETGIGGRGDPTNIVPHPHVTGITRLDLDHVSLLGNTIGEIAYHKGGIFKPGATALTMEQEPEGVLQLLECADAANVALGISKPLHEQHRALMGIPGDHQLSNAGLAVRIVEAWLQRNAPSTAMSKEGTLPAFVEAGLRRATWPGRSDLQLTKDVAYFIDGAHTSESMRCAAAWYAKALPRTTYSRTALIFNRTEDNKHELLRVLYQTLSKLQDEANNPVFDLVIFCTNALTPQIQATPDLMSLNPVTEPDTSQQESLARTWTALDSGRSEVKVVRSVAQAMEMVGTPISGLRRDSKSDGVGNKQQHTACLVTGSLKLVGPCLTILRGGVQV